MAEPNIAAIEHFKAVGDYLKHLATLATGSIIVLGAFLEKIILQPNWKPLVAVSLGGFVLSVLTSVVAYTILLMNSPVVEEETRWPLWERRISDAAMVTTWLSFLLGVLSLTLFLIKNLLR
ncbi:MAG: hypothetical protein AABM67_20925 [Acidobacteriota bacterium]